MSTLILSPEALELQFAAQVQQFSHQPLALVALLDEQRNAYHQQPPPAVARMRGWLLAALSQAELPPEALPYVVEELETAADPYLLAAAARALRAYAHPHPRFAPLLATAFRRAQGQDLPVGLDQYGDTEAATNATSPIQELLLTAAWLGPHAISLVPELAALQCSIAPRLRPILNQALATTQTPASDASCCPDWPANLTGIFNWDAARRNNLHGVENLVLEDQSGQRATYLKRFRGHPTIVVFFYTRCDNPLKCSLTLWKLGRVQKMLAERGLAEAIHTAAISYDPAFDTPERLHQYGANRRLQMDTQHHLLRAVDGLDALRRHFQLGVSFFESLVSRHRIELFLLDSNARIAGSFQRLSWQEDQVAEAAIALLTPPHPPKLSTWGPAAAIVAAAIPKCPLCWVAYLGALGITGVAILPSPPVLQASAVFFLLLHVSSVWWQGRATRWRQPAPLVMSFCGALAIALNLWLQLPGALPAGLALILFASLLNVRNRTFTPITR